MMKDNGLLKVIVSFQHIAGVSMVELCQSSGGEEGCTIASDEEIAVLLLSLRSSVATLRYVAVQCLQALALILPNMEQDCKQVFPVVQRVWTARFDTDSETSKLADRFVFLKTFDISHKTTQSLSFDLSQPFL